MSFVPSKGDLFYVSFKPFKQVLSNAFGDTKVVEQVDNSYDTDVFMCVAADATMAIGKNLTGFAASNGISFRISKTVFSPVGPDVARVLDLLAVGE